MAGTTTMSVLTCRSTTCTVVNRHGKRAAA